VDVETIKREVGEYAVSAHVESGMRIGMGTGSTAVWAIRKIGALLAEGKIRDILGVPTSFQSQLECEQLGIPLRSLSDPAIDGRLDLVIDGADEIDSNCRLTKGGGAALLLEKVIAYSADTVVIVADEQKLVDRLGRSFPVPVEIAAEARKSVLRRVRALGADGGLRMATRKMGPVITDNGNPLLDLTFTTEFDPVAMEKELHRIPGALGNGIFADFRPIVYVGTSDGNVRKL
jgi:ribose 5-phosphate isomerase A